MRKRTEAEETESGSQVRPCLSSASLSGTCDGGLENSSFLSFSCSWSLFCLSGAGWLAVCCGWEVTGSPADIRQTDFTSLGWSGSFNLTCYKGQSHQQREAEQRSNRALTMLRMSSTIHCRIKAAGDSNCGCLNSG